MDTTHLLVTKISHSGSRLLSSGVSLLERSYLGLCELYEERVESGPVEEFCAGALATCVLALLGCL